MFSPFERMVAGRYLRARKAEGFVSVIAGFSFTGILLGVATLIIVMSVMNGFRQELIGRILGINGHLNVYTQAQMIEDYEMMRLRIQEIDGVQFASPLIEGQALMTHNGNASGVAIRGMTSSDFREKPMISNSIVLGDPSAFVENTIAIGTELARRNNITVGDQLTLVSPNTKASPFGTMPRSRAYEVVAIFDVGMYEYNAGFVFMPLDTAQRFFRLPHGAKSLEVFLNDSNDVKNIANKIELLFQEEGIYVHDWTENNKSFFNALQVERNVMFLILTLIILVAAFNIISSMIMLVKDKGHDIAIMRTMGATRKSMMKIFILTGASIGFAGTVVGAVLGITFALNIESIRQFIEGMTGAELFADEIYFLSQLPAEIDWTEVVTVVAMAFALSILATLYPAWRAARLDPVEALRYE